MICRSFRYNCIARILLLTFTIWLSLYLFFTTEFYATSLIVLVSGVLQTISLLKYIGAAHQLLADTLQAVANKDFNKTLKLDVKDTATQDIVKQLNMVVEKIQEGRLELEHQFSYLQTVVEQTGMGLFSVGDRGDINLINRYARKILQPEDGSYELTHIDNLHDKYPKLGEVISKMESGSKIYWSGQTSGTPLQLSISMTQLQVHGEKYRLFTVQNIQNELEEKEMEAWKDLTRVLSHEIMNSLTPIASLAATANVLLGADSQISKENFKDLQQAIKTIETRSQGLMQFVNNYRKFSGIPKPNFKLVTISSLFARVTSLIKPLLEENAVEFSTSQSSENMKLRMDQDLIEQVLLNLLTNSLTAVKECEVPQIQLLAENLDLGGVALRVRDNGRGITEENLSKIFIPFFTTNPKGSGVGLSISRQIILSHGGSIRLRSAPGISTEFSLFF